MNTTAEVYGHAVLLNVRGELTADTLSAFKVVVDHQLAGKEIVDVVLNLEDVTFIDSAGLEYMLELQDRLEDKLGQVKLAKCGENILKILEITRLEAGFEMFGDVPEAVKAIGA